MILKVSSGGMSTRYKTNAELYALEVAENLDNSDYLQFLDYCYENGDSLLALVMHCDRPVEGLRSLLDAGADPNDPGGGNLPPIAWCLYERTDGLQKSWWQMPKCARVLLEYGAELNFKVDGRDGNKFFVDDIMLHAVRVNGLKSVVVPQLLRMYFAYGMLPTKSSLSVYLYFKQPSCVDMILETGYDSVKVESRHLRFLDRDIRSIETTFYYDKLICEI